LINKQKNKKTKTKKQQFAVSP